MAFCRTKIQETKEREIEYGRRSFAFLMQKGEGEEEELRVKDAKRNGAQNGAQERSDSAQNSAQERSDSARNDAHERSILQNERSWNIKAAKSVEKERHGTVKIIFFLMLFTTCILLTMREEPVKVQVCAYVLALAAFVSLDPFEALDRFLAPQTRIIISLIVLMIIANIVRPGKRILTATLMCALLGGFVSKCLNKKWLAAYNWLMSAEVQKSLRIDPEHTASLTWRAQGRRETRTILYELGFDVYDDILDAMHKPVYYCGYLHGLRKEKELKKQAESLTLEVEKCNEEYDALLSEYSIMQSNLEKSEAEAIQSEAEAQKWKDLFEREKELTAKLEKANEELLIEIDEPAEYIAQKEKIVSLKREERDRKIGECLDRGMPYREIQEYIGVSAGTISTVVKARKAKKQEAS